MASIQKSTFEQLCVRKSVGFACDPTSILVPSNPNTFDEVVFKLISRADSSLRLLENHNGLIESFTFVVIPVSCEGSKGGNKSVRSQFEFDAIEPSWESLHKNGWDCLQVLSVLTSDSLPDNGSREHPLQDYVTSVMDLIKANYKFQKPKQSFHDSDFNWKHGIENLDQCFQFAVAVVWKYEPGGRTKVSAPLLSNITSSILNSKFKNSLHGSMDTNFEGDSSISSSLSNPKLQSSFINSSFSSNGNGSLLNESSPSPLKRMKTGTGVTTTTKTSRSNTTVTRTSRGRNLGSLPLTAEADPPSRKRSSQSEENDSEGSGMEVDNDEMEITFKDKMNIIPKPVIPPMSSAVPQMMQEELDDIQLGFEVKSTASQGRKSMGRKGMSSDWTDVEKDDVLQLFDNFNPSMTEQSRIALTCKFAALQMNKDLPSKTLYQWIQKKGRTITRTITDFDLPDDHQKNKVLQFYKMLNPDATETARVGFTIKYVQSQYSLTLTSKQIFAWLSDKPKKGTKKR